MKERRSVLSLPSPRGLSCAQAAAYFGISETLFLELVDDGRAPRPRTINKRHVWDVIELDQAFSLLPHDKAGSNVEFAL